MRNSTLHFGVQIFLLCSLGSAQSSKPANSSDSNGAVFQELLSEVKLLRQAVERAVAVGAKTQVLLQRLQLQNERVKQASQRLEETRRQISKLLSDQALYTETMRSLQDQHSKEQDMVRRREMEHEMRQGKEVIERLTRSEPQLRVQESEGEAAFRKEQTVWEELSEQLSALERSLPLGTAPPPAAARP